MLAPSRLDDRPVRSDPGWTRTIALLDVGQASSPLDHGTVVSSQGGTRTHRHQALDLTALPDLRTRPSSCGGRTRTGMVGLMRPSWNLSSPLRSKVTKGRVALPRPEGTAF